MWLKFANWSEYKAKDVELARSCYERCCTVHLPKRANCRLEWATFEERHGFLEKSRQILEDLNDRVPGLLAVSARLFHLKRRAGKFSKEQLVGSLKTEWANSQEFRDRDGPEKEQFWACELAWYLCRDNRVAEARGVLESAMPQSINLLTGSGDIVFNPGKKNIFFVENFSFFRFEANRIDPLPFLMLCAPASGRRPHLGSSACAPR